MQRRYDPWSAFGQQPAEYDPRSVFGQQPAEYDPRSVFAQQPEYDQQPMYDQQPGAIDAVAAARDNPFYSNPLYDNVGARQSYIPQTQYQDVPQFQYRDLPQVNYNTPSTGYEPEGSTRAQHGQQEAWEQHQSTGRGNSGRGW